MPTFLAYHHANALGWLADVAMRGVIYSTIGRVMRSLSLTEVLIVCAAAVCLFLVFNRNA
jgi:hypothetical protein